MPVKTPQLLIDAIEQELRSVRVPLRRQVEDLRELFRLFTSDRAGFRGLSYLDTPALRTAYLRYHLPLNVARATVVLEHLLAIHPAVAALERVVDLGAGPGSSSIASLLALPPAPRAYLLTDRSRSALVVARRLMGRCGGGSVRGLSTVASSLPRLPSLSGRSLVWLSMVLNEIEARAPRSMDPDALLSSLAAALPPGSVLAIIEPALRGPARNLLRLHDVAVASGRWRVIAPCTHQAACPLLRERDRSWCHFHFSWSAPPLVRDVSDPLGIDPGSHSLSFLALERTGSSPSCRERERGRPRRARVVGDVMRVEGGKAGVYVCAEGERHLLVGPPPGTRRGDLVEETAAGARIELEWSGAPPARG